MAAFKAELQSAIWDELTGDSNPNSAYETFLNKYIAFYNKCFSLKKVKAGNGRNGCFNKPWLSKSLLKSITRKNILYKRYLCKPLLSAKINTKQYRNKLTCSLRAAKRTYYAKKLEECKSNMRSTLQVRKRFGFFAQETHARTDTYIRPAVKPAMKAKFGSFLGFILAFQKQDISNYGILFKYNKKGAALNMRVCNIFGSEIVKKIVLFVSVL